MASRGVLQALGPGLLFAAAAVGVSHLVQSTRAGAVYGLALVPLIIVANAVKYPAFRFGPQYAAATRTSLLEGYRRQGRWALVLYGILTLGTMFTVQAAVTVVTAGLAMAALGLPGGPVVVSAAILVICGALLSIGRYRWLDRITKVLVAVLTVSTLVATLAVLPKVDFSTLFQFSFSDLDLKTIFFLAALAGWMPSAIDVAVWSSLWTLARAEEAGHEPSIEESMVDFHIGYIGTASLALCFVIMGAGVMHGSGVELSDTAGGFAGQVIQLYTDTLGTWIRPFVATAAFAVMFSTTLTVLDGFPRAISALFARFRGAEDPKGAQEVRSQQRVYWGALIVLGAGGVLVLALFLKSLKTMIDVATTLSFLTAPVLSVLNHRAVHSAEVPEAARPKSWLTAASWAGIVVQAGFAVYYLIVRYG